MSKKIVAPAYVAAMARAEVDPASARFWVELDIGFKSTAVCVVDVDGAVVHQVSMKSHATEIGRYGKMQFNRPQASSDSQNNYENRYHKVCTS
ncbi:hypothetical protein QE385_002873 [Sphingomonas sp. SORGH_AS 950]|uniref:hypothetical protein n=1 Tax=Sphingomonas sp. SORGH_AS_0950 TaxID=3041792 RepID=UPI00278A32D4|nr:hypothetical protein [Sphingomonas sp. SORGH_AS_0950]MDQ1158546.1 hypothetical protein [Sphingomonas sp. SORGH_AS_0950]